MRSFSATMTSVPVMAEQLPIALSDLRIRAAPGISSISPRACEVRFRVSSQEINSRSFDLLMSYVGPFGAQ